jgi:hypothetical protein
MRCPSCFDEMYPLDEVVGKSTGQKRSISASQMILDRATKSWMDTKVGIIYSRVRCMSKNRNLITDKCKYVSLDNVGRFRERFYVSCHEMGVFGAELVIFLSNGATWIRTCSKRYF